MRVFVIFHCDEWKSHSSMRLIGVATNSSLKHVLHVIQEKCGYSKEDMETYIYVCETTTNDTEAMNI